MNTVKVTDEMVEAAIRVFCEEADLPFAGEQVQAGELRRAGQAAYDENRAFVRRLIQAALDAGPA